MKRILVLFIFCSANAGSALQITEIFYKGCPAVRSEERYIEIYNDGPASVDLSSLTVSVPKSDSASVELTVEKGNFGIRQNDIVTDSLVLGPARYAVIMTEDYVKYAKLLSFSPGTLVLKPKTKSFSGWSWAGRLGLVVLKTNGSVVFSCSDHSLPSDESVTEGSSISLIDGRYRESKLSPGENEDNSLYSGDRFLHEGSIVTVYYFDKNETNREIELTVTVSGKPALPFRLARSGDWWTGSYYSAGLTHGDDIRFQYGKKSILVRYLEKRPLAVNFRNVLINELVTDPKTDYSGGGWTGSDGGGTIDSTDEWIELVNTVDVPVSVSNYYLLYRTDHGESVKSMGVRYNPCFNKKSETISNYNYVVVNPESGLANSASIGLYEGYPWLDGRLVDELDYGGDASSKETWNNAPEGSSSGKEDEAVARVPNAVYDKKYRDVFQKRRASFGGPNSDDRPLLWARNVIGYFSNIIYLIDPGNPRPVQEVAVRNHDDGETVTLTNYGIYFRGMIPITNVSGAGNDGILNVKNGVLNTVTYAGPNGKDASVRFAWAEDSWRLPENSPDLSKVVLYPNPVDAGKRTTVVFANMPDQAEISVIDPFGNIIGKFISGKGGGFVEWETELKKGIYIAVIRSDRWISSKKLLVR